MPPAREPREFLLEAGIGFHDPGALLSMSSNQATSDAPPADERQAHNEHSLFLVVRTLLVLNLLDAIFTVFWLEAGVATEANPLMDTLLQWGPVPFVLGKTLLVSAGSYLLWHRRRRPLSVIGIMVLFLAYYWLLLYHLKALNLNLASRIADWLGVGA